MSCRSEAVICRQKEVLYTVLCEDEGIQSSGICRGQQSPLNINSSVFLKRRVTHLQLNA